MKKRKLQQVFHRSFSRGVRGVPGAFFKRKLLRMMTMITGEVEELTIMTIMTIDHDNCNEQDDLLV